VASFNKNGTTLPLVLRSKSVSAMLRAPPRAELARICFMQKPGNVSKTPTVIFPPDTGLSALAGDCLAALAAIGTVEARRASARPAPTFFITRDRRVK